MSHREEKAVATAIAYNQGDIAGLDDAMTRRLIASTVLTESNGGDLDITNSLGFVGRYQAGAGWLADAGYVDGEKLHAAMVKDGFTRESKWGAKGHMTEFLKDPANWKNGLSLDQYEASAELQDRAFKIISDKAYNQAIKEGVLSVGDDPATVAGFLKARHISGPAGARKALEGVAVSDDYQTSNIKYMEDITHDGDGLDRLMSRDPQRRSLTQVNTLHVTGPFHEGSRGKGVIALQADLAMLGYTDNRGDVLQTDGHFGRNTEAAVRAFQNDHGLLIDGIAGTRTLEAIQRQRQSLSHIPSLTPELEGLAGPKSLGTIEERDQAPQNAPAKTNLAQGITKDSSVHDMFEAICQAAANKDMDALCAVGKAYENSPAGQASLAQGAELNRQQAHAQALAEQHAQAQAQHMQQQTGRSR